MADDDIIGEDWSPDFCPPAPGKFSLPLQPPVEDLQAPSGPRHSARGEVGIR